MGTGLIEIRRAKPQDASAIAGVHDAAWLTAYRGIIPGLELERMVERRGPT
ncbi:MAG: GNAT family N-acetyltransferase, partial [Rhizobiales bacterium 32-66-8]